MLKKLNYNLTFSIIYLFISSVLSIQKTVRGFSILYQRSIYCPFEPQKYHWINVEDLSSAGYPNADKKVLRSRKNLPS